MKKYNIVITCAIFVLLMLNFSFVSASPVSFEVYPSKIKIMQNKLAAFDFKIVNNQNKKDAFLLNFDGPHLEWKMPVNLLTMVEPGSSKHSKIIFYPTKPGTYSYSVILSSFFNPSIKIERKITLEVRPQDIFIKNLDIKFDKNLDVEFVLVSPKRKNIDIQLGIKDLNGAFVKFFTYTESVDGTNKFMKSLHVDDVPAGEYTLILRVGGQTKERKFRIDPIHNILEVKKRIPGILYDQIIISVANQGNVVEYNYGHQEKIKQDSFTGFVTKPKDCKSYGNDVVCDFSIGELKPGEIKQIVYRIEYWPIYARYSAAILIIAILGLFSYPKVTRPRIKKKYIKKRRNEHRIIIEVKNPFKEVESVIVRDFVSPLAKVVHDFEHVKPIIKKSEAGTELIWKVGKMKPKEVRVLSYKIKGLVEGNLKMPKAYVRFRDANGNRIRVYSRHLVIQ